MDVAIRKDKGDGMNYSDDLIEHLQEDGWREYKDHFREYSRCFYKRFDTPTRCQCNDDKRGMQVCVAVSEYKDQTSYELDLAGELADGTWVKILQWIMPEDFKKGLALIPRMLATWEFMNDQETKREV